MWKHFVIIWYPNFSFYMKYNSFKTIEEYINKHAQIFLPTRNVKQSKFRHPLRNCSQRSSVRFKFGFRIKWNFHLSLQSSSHFQEFEFQVCIQMFNYMYIVPVYHTQVLGLYFAHSMPNMLRDITYWFAALFLKHITAKWDGLLSEATDFFYM